MKLFQQLLTVTLVAFSLGACQPDDEALAPQTFTGTWQLDEAITNGIAGGGGYTVKDLGYEQFYTLFGDNTFRKYRSTGAIAKGTYAIETIDNRQYAVLEIKESQEQGKDMPIVASCTQNRLYLYLEGGKLHDNNLACDIGLHIYRKTTPSGSK